MSVLRYRAERPHAVALAQLANEFVQRVAPDDNEGGVRSRLREIWLEASVGQQDPGAGYLCDERGKPAWDSPLVVQAVRRGRSDVGVGVASADGEVLASGRVGTRRSVAATLAAMGRVAGPLGVLANGNAPGRFLPWGGAQLAETGGKDLALPGRDATFADLHGTLRFAGRLLRASVTCREWACAPLATRLRVDGEMPDRLELAGNWQNGHPDRFWADPCIVDASTGGESGEWILVEEMDRRAGLGAIRALQVADGRLIAGKVVLRTGHHLSFPQVYRHGDRWLATVETCARTNPIYEFDHLGEGWRVAADLPDLPPHLADAVLDPETMTVVGTDARTDPDSVFLRQMFDAATGRWVADPESLFVDVGWARGGGTVDTDRDLRAVQDCSGTYGRAVGLTALADPAESRRAWGADQLSDSGSWKGIHTMTWTSAGDHVWIDGWRRRVTFQGGWLRLRERRHSWECAG